MQNQQKKVGRRVIGIMSGLVAVLTAAASCSPSSPEGRSGNNTAGTGSTSCAPGQTPCGNACVNLSIDPLNCGVCGTACSAGQQCTNGTCQACPGGVCQCAAPQTQCPSGCVDLRTNPTNCGTCGRACGAGEMCSNGSCVPSSVGTGGTGSGGTVGTGGTLTAGGAGGTPATAGSPSGGTASGGTGTGGADPTAGTAGTGTGPVGGPPGYTTWGDWHGCAWTGKGEFAADLTMITPADFVSKPAADPYCISGVVGAEAEYRSVALLGFNVNEPPPENCAYKAVDPNSDGPPSIVPMKDGIAVNYVKRGSDTSFTLRIQIQGPNGHKPDPVGSMDRWCAELTAVGGKTFVPYSQFTPKCWEMVESMRGTPYAKQPISAVVFTVPGSPKETPFDFCVNGFADGTSAADAPDGPAMGGDQMGTVGGEGSNDLDFARAKVLVDGKEYIIQNNNWGNPSATDLILNYKNNSFKIVKGSGSGDQAPASFPSIFIGANGNTRNGLYSTRATDGLPARISEIQSITSTFRYSGRTGLFNAAYDIWFAKSPPPTTSEYRDGIDGFVMIWLRDPRDKVPIGTVRATDVMIAGYPWNVWVGPRGQGPSGGGSPSGLPVIPSNPNAPVVSFVNPKEEDDSRSQDFVNKNIKEFLTAAAQYDISPDMYLTDVFAGFEIWQGGAGENLGVDEFTCIVNK